MRTRSRLLLFVFIASGYGSDIYAQGAAGAFGVALSNEVGAQGAVQRKVEVGGRFFQHWAGEGTLVGDMQGYGAYVGHRVWSSWSLEAGADRLYYDLEEPINVTAVRSADAKPVDTFVELVRVRTDVVRRFREGQRWAPFLAAGAAYYFISSNEADGMTEGGGSYRVHVETPNTLGVNISFGVDYRLARNVSSGIAFAYGRTFREYTVTDEVSGRSGKVNALSPLGLVVQMRVRL